MVAAVPASLEPVKALPLAQPRTVSIFRPQLAAIGTIHLTTAYGVRGAFNHNWDPYWSRSACSRHGLGAGMTHCPGQLLHGASMRATPVRLVRRTRQRQPAPELHYLGAWFCYPVTPAEPDVSAETIWPTSPRASLEPCVEPGATTGLPDDELRV